jgi:hypothetical protein
MARSTVVDEHVRQAWADARASLAPRLLPADDVEFRDRVGRQHQAGRGDVLPEVG